MDLLIVGSIGYDDIETVSASGSDILGGSAVHAGVSASFHLPRLPSEEPRVSLIAPIGEDFSDNDVKSLERAGLNFSGVSKLPGKTFRWSGKYEGDMDIVTTISTELNVLGDFEPAIPVGWNSPRVLFCANTHPDSQISVLDQCPNAGLSAIDTFMLWIETEFESLSAAIRKADIAILNEEEACAISGEGLFTHSFDPIMSGSALHGGEISGRGPRGMIVKRGSSGVMAKFPCGTIVLPAYPTDDIVDPTGCGDSFAGAFLSNMVDVQTSINDLEATRLAMINAIVTSSFTIGGLGSSKLQSLERGAYHARMDKYRRMVGL